MSDATPCRPVGGADAIFIGKVLSIDPSGTRAVEFAVVETFRGPRLSQVGIFSGPGNCRYSFKAGDSYLVHAYRSPDGQLSTSICSRTAPLSGATADLTYLRSLATIAPGALARVTGRVTLWTPSEAHATEALPRVTVTATGENRKFSARTNSRGEFALNGLPRGKYVVEIKVPTGYEGVVNTLDVDDPRGCGPVMMSIRYDGRVAGRVVDSRGRGVPGLPLDLVPSFAVDSPSNSIHRVQAVTAADGTFELRRVGPGEYRLGFNLVRARDGRPLLPRGFFPGVVEESSAAAVVVAPRERVRLRDFVIPQGLAIVNVAGAVVGATGQPVRDAAVTLRIRDPKGEQAIQASVVTGSDGRFAFALLDGGRYDVHVEHYADANRSGPPQVSIVPFTASAGTPFLRVVMKPAP